MMLSWSSCPFLPAVLAAWAGLGCGCASSSVFTSVSPSHAVDREGDWVAQQGVPAGWPLGTVLPRSQQHPEALALPRPEVLLPHLRQHAHRGALQHHPRCLTLGLGLGG